MMSASATQGGHNNNNNNNHNQPVRSSRSFRTCAQVWIGPERFAHKVQFCVINVTFL